MASLTTTLFLRRWLRHLPELLVASDVNGRPLGRHRAVVLVAQIHPLAAKRAVGASAIVHADILGEIDRRTTASSVTLTVISVTRTSGSTPRVIGRTATKRRRASDPRRFARLAHLGASIIVSGARPAAHAFWSRRFTTPFSDLPGRASIFQGLHPT